MSGYYSFNVADGLIKKKLSSVQFDFDNKTVFSRNVKDTDNIITIDLSDLEIVKTVLVASTKEITLTLNGVGISITNFLFMEVSTLTSLTVACSNAEGSQVEMVIWGVNS